MPFCGVKAEWEMRVNKLFGVRPLASVQFALGCVEFGHWRERLVELRTYAMAVLVSPVYITVSIPWSRTPTTLHDVKCPEPLSRHHLLFRILLPWAVRLCFAYSMLVNSDKFLAFQTSLSVVLNSSVSAQVNLPSNLA